MFIKIGKHLVVNKEAIIALDRTTEGEVTDCSIKGRNQGPKLLDLVEVTIASGSQGEEPTVFEDVECDFNELITRMGAQ